MICLSRIIKSSSVNTKTSKKEGERNYPKHRSGRTSTTISFTSWTSTKIRPSPRLHFLSVSKCLWFPATWTSNKSTNKIRYSLNYLKNIKKISHSQKAAVHQDRLVNYCPLMWSGNKTVIIIWCCKCCLSGDYQAAKNYNSSTMTSLPFKKN